MKPGRLHGRPDLLRTAGFRAALEYIIDKVNGVADIDRTLAIGVARLQRLWGRAALEHIIDKHDRVADVDLLIGVGITAQIGCFNYKRQGADVVLGSVRIIILGVRITGIDAWGCLFECVIMVYRTGKLRVRRKIMRTDGAPSAIADGVVPDVVIIQVQKYAVNRNPFAVDYNIIQGQAQITAA